MTQNHQSGSCSCNVLLHIDHLDWENSRKNSCVENYRFTKKKWSGKAEGEEVQAAAQNKLAQPSA